MITAAQIVRHLLAPNEWRARVALLLVFQKQRIGLPYESIRINNGAPAELLQQWEDEYISWFNGMKNILHKLWLQAIAKMNLPGVKTIEDDLYDDYFYQRSLIIGAELANVTGDAIGATLDVYKDTSWITMKYKLKECIGLQPRQINALAREATKLRAMYSPKQAQAMIDRLYNKKLNYRAQLIARNEMSTAINEAQRYSVEDKIARGVLPAMEKRWSTIGDNRVSEGCTQNESGGWIPFEDAFISGHLTAPRFPGCRCGLQYREVGARV